MAGVVVVVVVTDNTRVGLGGDGGGNRQHACGAGGVTDNTRVGLGGCSNRQYTWGAGCVWQQTTHVGDWV